MDAFGIVSMGNGVSVTGGATVKDGSDFFGSVKINNGLSVTGGASFSGTTNFITASIANGLSVTGGETITGNTKFFGNMTINGNLTVNGTHPFGSGGSDFSPILITASYTNPTTAQWFTIDATGMSPGRWYHYELTYKRTAPTTVNVPLGIRFKGYTGHVYLLTDYAYAYKKWDSTLVIKI